MFSSGSGNAASLYNTAGNWDTVNGLERNRLRERHSQTFVSEWRRYDLVRKRLGQRRQPRCAGGWDTVQQFEQTPLQERLPQAYVVAVLTMILFSSGSGNAVSLSNTAGNWDAVVGSNGTVYENGTQTFVSGGGDTIAFSSGSGNAASLYNTGGNWDTVTGSNGAVYENGTQTDVLGNGDTIAFAGSGEATPRPASDSNDLFCVRRCARPEHDQRVQLERRAMQFSKSDFTSFQALQPHISQSGANTLITLDASDQVTLTGVTASSLTASQFHFV